MSCNTYRLVPARIRVSCGALACSALLFGCSTAGPATSSVIPAPADEKMQVRNNASSLLAQLLDEEKNVSKILIIKHASREVSQLIEAISAAAGDSANRLKGLAQGDPTLDLTRQDLPAGEKASRDAEGKTEEHELLFSSGANFEFNLLLTQAQALGYGSHLAKVAADNSADPREADALLAMSKALDELLDRVKASMRSPASN
jgi:hypothetical protein